MIHCNDRFWENIHAEVVGSRGSYIRRCYGAIGDMVHVEFDGHCVGYIDVESAGIRAILDGGFDDLKGSCNRSNCFCSLYWQHDITKRSNRLFPVFRLDHDVRERARLGMAERIYDVIGSSDIDIGNYCSQQKALITLQ